MDFDSLFWVAFQSSLFLGLVHGVNPCGHSWLVLAPFVAGEKRGRKVSFLTAAFLLGTSVACVLLGLTLGAVSRSLPAELGHWVELGTAVLLMLLGFLLIVKPHLLHHHDHHHHHEHAPDEDLAHQEDEHCHGFLGERFTKRHKATGAALLTVGFVNMIVPCPTVAVMYGYALDSANVLKATLVFSIYAVGTAIAVGGVIFAIFHIAKLLKTLSQGWIETAVMRGAGVLTVFFGTYSLVQHL